MRILIICLMAMFGLNGFAQTVDNFTLIELPYATDALEPVISKQTVELHHGKHLQGYVNNLNKLKAGTAFDKMPLEEIVAKSDGALFNNAGQTLNHNLYFLQFSPNGKRTPDGKLADAINAKWGSFDNFKKEFVKAGTGVFGSGWVWLARDNNGQLVITQEANAGNPITKGFTPLMGIDVWEHAYYLDYQNRRADHLDKVWDIIDWEVVGKRF